MKTILTFLLMSFMTLLSTTDLTAQNLPNNPVTVTAVDPRGAANTTLVAPDTAIVGNTLPVKTLYATYTVTTTLTKVSGTVAGIAVFQGSTDGVKFYPISSDTLVNQTTNNLSFEDGYGTNWNFYRIYITNSGTNTVTVSDTKYLYKK